MYCVLRALGRTQLQAVKHDRVFGPFLAGYLIWLIGPLERRLIGRVSPNLITIVSLLMCAATGASVGEGALGAAAWLYALAGVLDILDGRVARLGNKQTPAGALLDSVADRWGELFVFAGYTWFLRQSPWLLAVLGAFGGSVMVSYTRARAEGLGVALSTGIMQRAERIVLVAVGTLAASALDAPTAEWVIGITMSTTACSPRYRRVALVHGVSRARRACVGRRGHRADARACQAHPDRRRRRPASAGRAALSDSW